VTTATTTHTAHVCPNCGAARETAGRCQDWNACNRRVQYIRAAYLRGVAARARL